MSPIRLIQDQGSFRIRTLRTSPRARARGRPPAGVGIIDGTVQGGRLACVGSVSGGGRLACVGSILESVRRPFGLLESIILASCKASQAS